MKTSLPSILFALARFSLLPGLVSPAALGQWTEIQKLQPASGRSFGGALALDGTTMVIGSSREDGNAGAAYVYERQGNGTWVRVARLTASDREPNDEFGASVALSGPTVVVGAPDRRGVGGAYVFEKPVTGWADATQNAKLTAPRPGGDQFGHAVAVSGPTVVVGDPFSNERRGAVYVLEKPAGGWANASMIRLSAPAGEEGARIGASVAVWGTTVVAGAIGLGSNRGAVVVFDKPAGGWSTFPIFPRAVLAVPGADANDYLGWAVAIEGGTVVATAVGYARNQGAAYVFEKPAGGWIAPSSNPVARLTDPGASPDRFGNAVSTQGGWIVVGAFRHSTDRGAAYAFKKPSGGWATTSQAVKLTASDGAMGDLFGGAVGVGGSTVVVGALRASSGQGAGYVFGPSPAVTSTNRLVSVDPSATRPADGPPALVVAPNPASGGEIRCRVSSLDNPAFGLTTSTGRHVGVAAKTDGSGEFVLTPRQALAPGVYLLQATGNGVRVTQRVLVTD